MKRTLGTCYYPEHWPREIWIEDAQRMADAGLTWVRIGEFAWARMEPVQGQYDFDWLDDAIEILGNAGLKVVLGTPTATPPRWMIDKYPDMLAVDAQGNPRKFGSRRHYCFSHEGYKSECARIVTALAERYGRNPHVAAWQTDNEYSCHNTTLSYSDAARQAFRGWLRNEFPAKGNDGDIEALNAAWGNVFWSMDYDTFDQVDLPNLTVTEANPSHRLAFMRFSSNQVVRFNRLQTDIIRAHSDAPIAHNYMGLTTDFDHFAVGADLDIASWDSYPLGFLEDRVVADDTYKRRFARQGDPDFQAFHHDLYRAVGRGRWWIMEQQPGPVNWAPYNPAPLPGMVRLWTWEAFAHGAEAVCYFRWRQAPMAQEQLHAGLLRPDSVAAPAMAEAQEVAAELSQCADMAPAQAKVAMIFDYDAAFAWTVLPHGKGLSYFGVVFEMYRAMRKLGLSVDILPGTTRDFEGYKIIAAPGLMHMAEDLKSALIASDAEKILGPRSAARDWDLNIPTPLPPAVPGLEAVVSLVETIRPDMDIPLSGGGAVRFYREALDGSATIVETTSQGEAVAVAADKICYVGGWLDQTGWQRVIKRACDKTGVETIALPEGLRRRETGTEVFWLNYDTQAHQIADQVFPPISVTRQDKPN